MARATACSSAGRSSRGCQGYQLALTPAALYRTSLRAIGEELPRRGFDFASAPAEEQDALLAELEAGRRDLGGFSSAIFFETLLANIIEGYFADPAYGGNWDMVSWRMIDFPGAYAAYLGVYTQHGIRFDREPLSMAHSHTHP
jgi:gluconate 2-dehydrogenase gamma chain